MTTSPTMVYYALTFCSYLVKLRRSGILHCIDRLRRDMIKGTLKQSRLI